MPVERIACPSCGAPLDVPDTATQVRCQFCGSSLRLNFGPPPAPPDTGIEANGAIRDKATGKGLFTGRWPGGWHVGYTSLDMASDTSRPYRPTVLLADGRGATMVFLQGGAGTRMGAMLKGTVAMYGGHLRGIDRTNYAEMPNPIAMADSVPLRRRDAQREGWRLVSQLVLPNLPQRVQQTLARFQRLVTEVPVTDPFVAEVMRVFESPSQGGRRIASFVRLTAVKLEVGMPGLSAAGGLVGLVAALGQASRQGGKVIPQSAYADNWRTHDQAAYAKTGTIAWDVDLAATLECAAADFDALFPAFTSSLLAAQVHPDILNLTRQAQQQQDAAIMQSTQGALARQQAAFQVQQAAQRQVEAAMDSRNAAWQAQQDAHHAQVMGGSGGSGSRPDFSEAIRGVNTYTTSDGREVRISVQVDHAWENQGGDVIGTPGSFDPGSDWTELSRR